MKDIEFASIQPFSVKHEEEKKMIYVRRLSPKNKSFPEIHSFYNMFLITNY